MSEEERKKQATAIFKEALTKIESLGILVTFEDQLDFPLPVDMDSVSFHDSKVWYAR